VRTTIELERENAQLRAELEAAQELKRDVGELATFMSETCPTFAGLKSTKTAISEITRLRAALTKIRDSGRAADEPFSKTVARNAL
jgi:hypothetical protein